MKIGILAFNQAINYGAGLQIYALQETIKSLQLPNTEIYIINYFDPGLAKEYQIFQMKGNFITDLIRNIIYAPSRLKKKRKFDNFYTQNMKLTETVNSLSELNDFDTLIVGSDQVWNTDITNFDTTYVLDSPKSLKKISYAASIGKQNLTIEDETYFGKHLNDFSAISVREEEAKIMLQDIVKQEIEVTLDPTLLLPKEKWQKLSEQVEIQEKYILVYALEENIQLQEIAQQISSHFELPLRHIIPQGSISDRVSLKYATGPAEFLSLVENSEFVVTNSFHGTCFSVIYEKAFITVPHQSRGGRMVNLLRQLNLEDRLLYTSEDLILDKHIKLSDNHLKAKELLKNLVEESVTFLKKSLEVN